MSNQEIDPRYQRGKIYKIVGSGMRYYGSTIETLNERLKIHKAHYKRWVEGKAGYCKSFDIISKGNYEIKLVRLYPCNNKPELERKEGRYILKNECINKVIPGRTMKEYYQDNKEKIKEKHKEWKQNNKEKVKEYKKLTFQCLCDGEQHNLNNRYQHFKTQYHITNLKAICDIYGVDPNEL